MRRVHLFEFEDLAWFPASLRNMMTEYLQHAALLPSLRRASPGGPASARLRLAARAAAPRLPPPFPRYVAGRVRPVLEETGCRAIVDLGSGSGGIVPALARALEEAGTKVRVTLTDRYPNREALAALREHSGGSLDFEPGAVDARAVPAHLRGLRSLFLSLHHFRPADARAILADAARAGQPVAAFEATERRAASLALFVPSVLVLVLALTPWIRPFRWSRLVLTYLVPLLPLLILWDGVVSHLRTYSAEELRELVAGIDAPGYRWDVRRERIPGTPGHCISLVGIPAA